MTSLAGLLDASAIVTDPEAMLPYLADWRGRYTGSAQAVLKPRNVEEVASVMRWATATGTPVVPQGGNTGLSGGATPDATGRAIVLSLERMNRIRAVDPVGNTLIAEAGCILAHVQNAAADSGRLFPVSLGSEGSCRIGGILATNAGGINVVRYGMTRDLVLGLEYVTATGMVVPGPKNLRKDNAGYNLRQLLVGSEGTLAILTAAAFRIVTPPRARVSALCGVASPEAALSLLQILREAVAENIVSFELMCDSEMDLVLNLVPNTGCLLSARHAWYVFTEIGGDDSSVGERLAGALEDAIETNAVADAVLSQSDAQAKAIWHLRFAVSEANRLAGPSVSHDVSVATEAIPAFLSALSDMVAARFPDATPLFVGHLGDGNMHVNVLFRRDACADSSDYEAMARRVNAAVYDLAIAHGGSITAEHGIGRSIRDTFASVANAEELRLMQGIKKVFDPAGILNPGTVLPPTIRSDETPL